MPQAIDILRAKRIAAKMTQEQLGKHFGVPKQTISRWELGQTKIAFDTIVEWASLLDVPLAELLTSTRKEEA